MSKAVAIVATGLVTSIGLDALSTCAATRAMVTNPRRTHCFDRMGQAIMAHEVPLVPVCYGLSKLTHMAVMAMEEALAQVPKASWAQVPVLLCVAESDRPGRLAGLDDRLWSQIQAQMGVTFASGSLVVSHGRVAVAVALDHARKLIHERGVGHVLIVSVDSLLQPATISHFDRSGRLLTSVNSDGFMPGEGAGALLVGRASPSAKQMLCHGLGFGIEQARIDADEPLRADGLTSAIKMALQDAACAMHDVDYRIADLSGEQYYFKEASLALSRTLRQLKDEFDLWHPAECTGEAGALAGVLCLAVAHAACEKRYSKGPSILVHLANDNGARAAIKLQFGGTHV